MRKGRRRTKKSKIIGQLNIYHTEKLNASTNNIKPQNSSLPSTAEGVSVRGQPRHDEGECSLGVGGVFIY